MRGEADVSGEKRLVAKPMFHSWDTYTMPLMRINSVWTSDACSHL